MKLKTLWQQHFLKLYHDNPNLYPKKAKEIACKRWYGNKKGTGVPKPPDKKDRAVICALAQMDLFFVAQPYPHPKYTWDKALKRCKNAHPENDPCACGIAPKGGKEEDNNS